MIRSDAPMNLEFTPDQQLLRRSVREFAEAELRPHIREWDEAQQFPRELLSKLAELGLMGIQFPEQFGGAALSAVDYCICIEELARVDPSVSLTVAAHNGLGAAHIAMFGTDDQKRTYLAPLARGDKLAAWGLTEASAGSDAVAMRTTATRDGECWVINGTKQFITHGRSGDLMVVMAVTNRSKGSRGISAFIVERATTGFRAGKKEDKLGMRASETSEVIFENCRVTRSQMLGQEDQGFINALQVLDAGRIGIAALAVGLAQGAYEAARRYAFERDAHPGGAVADLSRCIHQACGAAHDTGSRHGETLLERDCRARVGGWRADSRRLRIREGLSGGEVLPRRQADHHRRRYQ
jgi:alkylation response protein AidB-like acyl-CoA dehydrogenase